MINDGAIAVPIVLCREIKPEIGASNDMDDHYVRQNVHDDAWTRQAVRGRDSEINTYWYGRACLGSRAR